MISLKAPAKINLGLSIQGKLPNGYHEVKTIYCQVSLFDTIDIQEINENKIKIYCDNKYIPTDKRNLVYKAADLIKKQTKTKKGVEIYIKKRIPVGSGLGGGSSDAAVVLKALNQLWELNLSMDRLIKLAKIIGADTAYHLIGGIQLEVQGGKKSGKFISLGQLPKCYILLSFPNVFIQSIKAYSQVKYNKIGKNNLGQLIKAVENKDVGQVAVNLHNDFELWTFEKFPVILKIKKLMLRYGALASLMSGKGSTVFGLFDSRKTAQNAFLLLRKTYPKTYLTEQYYQKN